MNATLSRFAKEFGLQLRLIAGHWSYWVMHAVFGALIFALPGGFNVRSAEAMLTASLGTISAGLIMLMCMLLSGMAAARATQSRFDELAASFPSGNEVLLGGWLASLLAGTGFLLEPLILAGMNGPFDSFLAGLSPFCWYTLACALVGSAFTWWLSGWLKFRRWVYPLLAAAWAGFWLGPMFLSRAGINLALIDIPTRMQNADYDALFGRLEPPALALWFCLFIASLGLILLSLALWRQAARRQNRRLGAGLVGALLALALCGFSAAQFSGVMNALKLAGAQNPDALMPPAQSVAAQIDSYDVSVDTTGDVPQVAVTFTLRNLEAEPQDTFTVALSHNFTILTSSVAVTQNQNTLELKLPQALASQEQVEITLTYEGTLTTYMDGPQIPIATQFLDRNKVRLGLYAYWLPVAGDENIKNLAGMGALVEPVAVHLTLKTPPNLTNYTNLTEIAPGEYNSPAATWLFWVASSRMVEKTIGSLHAYGLASDLDAAGSKLDLINGFFESLQAFFPGVNAPDATLLLFDTRNAMAVTGVDVVDNRPVLVVPYIFFGYWDQSNISTTTAIGSALIEDLYQMSGGSSLDGANRDVLGHFMCLNYELKGDSAAIRAALIEPHPLADVLLSVLEQSGQDGLMQAVEALRNAPVDYEDENAVADWLKASLNVH